MVKLDKLGRKIPDFDRSAAAKKAVATNKEKYGTDFYARIGASGDHSRNRGHFGNLKDSGKEDDLKALAVKGGRIGRRKPTKNKGDGQG